MPVPARPRGFFGLFASVAGQIFRCVANSEPDPRTSLITRRTFIETPTKLPPKTPGRGPGGPGDGPGGPVPGMGPMELGPVLSWGKALCPEGGVQDFAFLV